MKTRIYLVRHGESEHNIADIVSGHVNPELTERGRQQAKQARSKFSDVEFDAVYTSDLTRAIHTAELLVQQLVHKDNQLLELRERNYGSLDGGPSKHLIKGNELKKLLAEDEAWHHKHVPDMESDHELVVRYVAALEKLAKANPGKTILIVAHGTAIRTTLRKLLGSAPDKFPSGSFKNTDHAIVDYEHGIFKVIETPDQP